MNLHPSDDVGGRSTHADLRAPARRGLFVASALCAVAALVAGRLATRAPDDVHRAMFAILSAALGVATLVLQIVRISLRPGARLM